MGTSSNTRSRRRRDQRVANPVPMRLTDRDKQIILAVWLYRVLGQIQIQILFFRSKNTCQRTLARLYLHGFLQRVFWPVVTGSPPTLYVLDKKGVDLLKSEFGYDDLRWYPTSRILKGGFLEHTNAINDFRIAVTLAAQQCGYALEIWKNESELKAQYDYVRIQTRFGLKKTSVIPDGFFLLSSGPQSKARFFLELDRGTETTERFQTKVKAYIAYRESG